MRTGGNPISGNPHISYPRDISSSSAWKSVAKNWLFRGDRGLIPAGNSETPRFDIWSQKKHGGNKHWWIARCAKNHGYEISKLQGNPIRKQFKCRYAYNISCLLELRQVGIHDMPISGPRPSGTDSHIVFGDFSSILAEISMPRYTSLDLSPIFYPVQGSKCPKQRSIWDLKIAWCFMMFAIKVARTHLRLPKSSKIKCDYWFLKSHLLLLNPINIRVISRSLLVNSPFTAKLNPHLFHHLLVQPVVKHGTGKSPMYAWFYYFNAQK